MTDRKLIKIATEYTKGLTEGNLSRMCFITSFTLAGYLHLLGVDCEVIEGEVEISEEEVWNHYWLKLKDGRILDPTAGQFKTLKMSNTYLGELPQQYKVIQKDLLFNLSLK